VEVLRYCYSAMDALEEEPADIMQGCSCFHSALQVAPGVREAVKKVEEQAVIMMGLVAGRAASGIMAEANHEDADDSGSEASQQEDFEQSVADASMALTQAIESHTNALAEASQVFQDLGSCQDDSRYIAERFHDVCNYVVRAVKDLAMAAFDVAVMISDIARELEVPQPADVASDDEHAAKLPSDEVEDSEIPAKEGAEGKEDESQPEPAIQKDDDDEDNTSDMQESLRTIVEAIHMLRITNQQVLRLQREALGLACKDPQAMPEVSIERRQRCFQLVTELLDEACVLFHEQMHTEALADPTRFTCALGTCAVQAAARGFKFLLRSDAALAVPLDATAQALRAAVALDHAAIRKILQEQVLPRLEVSLQGAHLAARCQGMEACCELPSPRTVDEDVLAVLESLQCTLLDALDGLQAGLTADVG